MANPNAAVNGTGALVLVENGGARAQSHAHWAMILLLFLLCLSPTVSQGQVPTGRTLPGVPDSPFPYATPEESGLSSEPVNGLVATARKWVEDGDVVGAEILLMKDRRIVLHQAVGWRDKEKGLPLERNSIYRIRSMTKPFTATAVFILMEEGRLSLEDPVARYLPSWQNDSSRDITIRQLLSHTGGFVQGGFPRSFWSYGSLRAAVDAVGAAGPQHPPGENYEYSDVGSATLGALVEEISGLPVEKFIQDRILEPLALTDTHTAFSPEIPWASRVNPTYSRSDPGDPWAQYWDPSQPQRFPFFRASGGLYTTILDYARWLTVFMELGVYDEGRLLSEETIREAIQPAASRGYGLHWEIFSSPPEDGELPAFGHGGSDGTLAVAMPSYGVVALVFTQSRGGRVIRQFPMAVWNAVSAGEENAQGEG